MFALIPIVNVPFDWASLGLTRALLRRGVEEGAPSPLWLGLGDFVLGLILLALLAVALIAALQTADALIAHFGGVPVAMSSRFSTTSPTSRATRPITGLMRRCSRP